MRYLIAVISLVVSLYANGISLIDDAIKAGKGGSTIICHLDDPAILLNAERISQVTSASLKLNKMDQNIQALLNLAIREHRLQHFSDQFTYIPLYKTFKNGDRLLLDCLKDSTCNLARYTQKIQNTYLLDKGRSTFYTIKGFMNDMKVHKFLDGKGKILNATISEVVDLKRVIKMPYIGSIYKNANAAGFKRDATEFWKKYRELYPETLSRNNKARLNVKPNSLSPIVDRQWIKFNPLHKSFLGEVLEHHHLNNTDITVAIPKSLHRGQNNKELMHVD
jgi:hypothetical protein